MTMRKRAGGSIISEAMADMGWDPALDPGSLLKPMPQLKSPPICHCPPPEKNRLGGMSPVIDRDNAKVVCKVCRKEIGPACKRRHVVHLRGLIALDQKNPQNVDWADVEDAGWLL